MRTAPPVILKALHDIDPRLGLEFDEYERGGRWWLYVLVNEHAAPKEAVGRAEARSVAVQRQARHRFSRDSQGRLRQFITWVETEAYAYREPDPDFIGDVKAMDTWANDHIAEIEKNEVLQARMKDRNWRDMTYRLALGQMGHMTRKARLEIQESLGQDNTGAHAECNFFDQKPIATSAGAKLGGVVYRKGAGGLLLPIGTEAPGSSGA